MVLKADISHFNFNVTEVGESSEEVDIHVTNTGFDNRTDTLSLDAPFCFNKKGEASEEIELTDVLFSNALSYAPSSDREVIDMVYSKKQKALFQLWLSGGEDLKLIKINVSDENFAVGATWVEDLDVGGCSRSEYIKTGLVLDEDENYIFCLRNEFSSPYDYIYVSVVSTDNALTIIRDTQIRYGGVAGNQITGVDLILFNKKINSVSDITDTFVKDRCWVHGYRVSSGDTTGQMYHNGDVVQDFGLHSYFDTATGESVEGVKVFYFHAHSFAKNMLASITFDGTDWSEIACQYIDLEESTSSNMVISDDYIWGKTAGRFYKGERCGVFSTPGPFGFCDSPFSYTPGEEFLVELSFTPNTSLSHGHLFHSFGDYDLKYSDTSFKIIIEDSSAVIMETTIEHEFEAWEMVDLILTKNFLGEFELSINGTEVTLSTNNSDPLAWVGSKVGTGLNFYHIKTLTVDGFKSFSLNPSDPFDGMEASRDAEYAKGFHTMRVTDSLINDDSYSISYDEVENKLYFCSSDGFGFLSQASIELMTINTTSKSYGTPVTTFERMSVVFEGNKVLFQGKFGSDLVVTDANRYNGELYTKDSDFWVRFKPTAVGSYSTNLRIETFIFLSTLFGVAIEAVVEDEKDYAVVRFGEGYKDFQRKELTASETINIFNREGGENWVYNPSTGEFVNLSYGEYDREQVGYKLQEATDDFEAFFDTINILFEPRRVDDTMTDTNIKLFVKTAISMARIEVSYTSDGNYSFDDNRDYGELGEDIETGSFDNSAVLYMGSRQIAIKEVITDQREAKSLKLRVYAKVIDNDDVTSRMDDFKVFSINILSEGMVTINGGTDG